MSGTPANILTQPGFLFWEPTTLAGGPPFGGTSLGFTETGVRIRTNQTIREIKGEESGEEALEIINLGNNVKIFVSLKQWEDVTIDRAFPGLTAAGATDRFVQIPGTLKPGARMSQFAGKLLFAPEDLTNNKVALFHRVVPQMVDAADLQMRLREDTMLELVFHALRDDSIASSEEEFPYRIAFIGDQGDGSIEP